MNLLNENIARLRKQAGMTQEELGQKVMVSTQAVSRWERGGTPDVAMLPKIAQVFGVSIDELFGIQRREDIPVEDVLLREVERTPEQERFERAWQLCWHTMKCVTASCNGSSGDTYFRFMSGSENMDRKGADNPERVPAIIYVTHDTGLMTASLVKDFHYLLLMPEPEDGYAAVMKRPEAYRDFFAFLAKPKRMEMLALLYMQEPTRYFTASLASQQLGISTDMAEEILQEFYSRRMVQDLLAKAPEGTIRLYRKLDDTAAIPFLYFASEVMRSQSIFNTILMRTEPFFRENIGENSLSPDWISREEMDARLFSGHSDGCQEIL